MDETMLLQAIGQMMDDKLKPIHDRLDTMDVRMGAMETKIGAMDVRMGAMETKIDTMEAKIERLQEDSQVTRSGVNSLLEWAEECGNVLNFPLPKVK